MVEKACGKKTYFQQLTCERTLTPGAYTTVTVFTGDGIAKQPGFGQKTVHMGAWVARFCGDCQASGIQLQGIVGCVDLNNRLPTKDPMLPYNSIYFQNLPDMR